MKEEYVMILVFPEDGSVQGEVLRQDMIQFDGEQVVVMEQSTGVIVPVKEVDEALDGFRREAK